MLFPLQRLHIENFRGFRDTTVDLHPRVTVFFGSNAAGKTSLLDALTIALGAYVKRVPRSESRDFARSGDLRVPWLDRPGVGERAQVEAPFSRISIIEDDEVVWEVSKYRSTQDRERSPESVGRRQLHAWLDPRVREALDAPAGATTPPIPLVASYGTERAVVEVPLRQRDFRGEFHRLAGLDRALKATTRFKAVFEWFYLMEDQERRGQQQRENFDYRLPALQWVRRAIARA